MVWVEQTRSCQLSTEEKLQLCEVVDASPELAENPDTMAIAIEFRLKPLIQKDENSVAGRKSESESKAYKQLKQDCMALVSEHPEQICFATDP